jgi:hypothetical protein
MRFGIASPLAIALFLLASPLSTQARPLEDRVAEVVREKVKKCDLSPELSRVRPLSLCQTPTIFSREMHERICQQQFAKEDEAEKRRVLEALKNHCVIDSFSFSSVGAMVLNEAPAVSTSGVVEERKNFRNCTQSPQDYLETITLSVQEGYKVALQEAYSHNQSDTNTVAYSDVRTRTRSSSAGGGVTGSVGNASASDSSSSSRTVTNSKTSTQVNSVEFSLSKSQTQERISTRSETRPEQFTVPSMRQYLIVSRRFTEETSHDFTARVLVDARVTVPESKRAGLRDEFTSDGSAYLSELISDEDRTFEISGSLLIRALKNGDVLYNEKALSPLECES